MPKLAKHTLGAYWKRATPDEQTEYVKVFTEYMSAVYGKRFAEYSGQSLAVQRINETGRQFDGVHHRQGRRGRAPRRLGCEHRRRP